MGVWNDSPTPNLDKLLAEMRILQAAYALYLRYLGESKETHFVIPASSSVLPFQQDILAVERLRMALSALWEIYQSPVQQMSPGLYAETRDFFLKIPQVS